LIPATLLLLGIGRYRVPLPWFPLWLVGGILAASAFIVGHAGLLFFPGNRWFRAAAGTWRIVLLAARLHGMEVKVESQEFRFLLKFI